MPAFDLITGTLQGQVPSKIDVLLAVGMVCTLALALLFSLGDILVLTVGASLNIPYVFDHYRHLLVLLSLIPLAGASLMLLGANAFTLGRGLLLSATLMGVILLFTRASDIRPRTSIHALFQPKFVSVADTFLGPADMVVGVVVGAEARAYPLKMMTWHHVINDTVGTIPMMITFCPLCNSGVAFSRLVDEQRLTFEVGTLTRKNLVMSDRETGTWWQQLTGEAVQGPLLGKRLSLLPVEQTTWEEWRMLHPNTHVLSPDTGYAFDYSHYPSGRRSLLRFPTNQRTRFRDGRLPERETVLGVTLNNIAKAYPFAVLSQKLVINDVFGSTALVIFFNGKTRHGSAFERTVNGKSLSFAITADAENSWPLYVDTETNTRWNVDGQAVEGPLTGYQLRRFATVWSFWFAWGDFHPDTLVYSGGD